MLRLSKDRKVSNITTKSGNAVGTNSFGLPAGVSCPGATSFCDSICYAKKLERIPYLKSVRDILKDNMTTLIYADYLDGIPGMVKELSGMVQVFYDQAVKRNAPKLFRIHWDGDFFSNDYAKAWAEVVRSFPDVQFWVYIRSFNVLPFITGIDNLSVYISADPINISVAKKLSKLYDVPIAYVDNTFDAGRDKLEGKTYVCPENKGTLPLITKKGSACARCGVCVYERGNVLFSVSNE